MPSKKIRIREITLLKNADGEFATSVSVATHSALVVISEIAMPDPNTMIGIAIITEDEVDE